jgi:hypothetical protein
VAGHLWVHSSDQQLVLYPAQPEIDRKAAVDLSDEPLDPCRRIGERSDCQNGGEKPRQSI